MYLKEVIHEKVDENKFFSSASCMKNFSSGKQAINEIFRLDTNRLSIEDNVKIANTVE